MYVPTFQPSLVFRPPLQEGEGGIFILDIFLVWNIFILDIFLVWKRVDNYKKLHLLHCDEKHSVHVIYGNASEDGHLCIRPVINWHSNDHMTGTTHTQTKKHLLPM